MCADAIKFYQKVFNATVLNITYERDAPPDYNADSDEDALNNIIHSELIISGTRVNMADGAADVSNGSMFLFNIFLDSADEIKNIFTRLSDGGEVLTELGGQFWSPLYGEVRDKFGVWWQLILNQ